VEIHHKKKKQKKEGSEWNIEGKLIQDRWEMG